MRAWYCSRIGGSACETNTVYVRNFKARDHISILVWLFASGDIPAHIHTYSQFNCVANPVWVCIWVWTYEFTTHWWWLCQTWDSYGWGNSMQDLDSRYNHPVIALNLLKTIEKQPRESLLGKEYEVAINQVNKEVSHVYIQTSFCVPVCIAGLCHGKWQLWTAVSISWHSWIAWHNLSKQVLSMFFSDFWSRPWWEYTLVPLRFCSFCRDQVAKRSSTSLGTSNAWPSKKTAGYCKGWCLPSLRA